MAQAEAEAEAVKHREAEARAKPVAMTKARAEAAAEADADADAEAKADSEAEAKVAGAVMSAGAKMSADVKTAISRPFRRRARGTAADAPEGEQLGAQPSAAPGEAPTMPSATPAPSPDAPLGVTLQDFLSLRAAGAPLIPLPRVTELRSSVELDASDRRSSSDRPASADLLVPTLSAEDHYSITRLQQLEQRLRLSTMAASGPRSRSASKDGEAPADDRSCSTLAEILRVAKVS